MRPRTRWARPVVAALALVAVAGALAGCRARTASGAPQPGTATAGQSSAVQVDPPPGTPTSSAQPRPTRPVLLRAARGATPVHVMLAFDDGNTYGVGLPVVAYFSARFANAATLDAATTVTVNGKKVSGGHWFFEQSGRFDGFPVEGHFRLRTYWPAHAHIVVSVPVRGLSAGTGFGFDDSVSFTFNTGAAQLMTVDGTRHTLTLYVDGRRRATYPVSLGQSGLATQTGIKVVMEHLPDVEMKGPGYDDPDVQWDERLTIEGEYLHSAPWNIWNIEHGVDSSHGCTNLRPDDAYTLYRTLRVGDVVDYVHVQENTSPMTMADGWGDWNVAWSTWLSGGLIPLR